MIAFLLVTIIVLICTCIGLYYSEEYRIKFLESLEKEQAKRITLLEREVERLKDELQASIEDSDILYQDYCEVMRLWHDEG